MLVVGESVVDNNENEIEASRGRRLGSQTVVTNRKVKGNGINLLDGDIYETSTTSTTNSNKHRGLKKSGKGKGSASGPTGTPSVSLAPSRTPSGAPSGAPSVSLAPSRTPSGAPSGAPSVSLAPSTSAEPSQGKGKGSKKGRSSSTTATAGLQGQTIVNGAHKIKNNIIINAGG